MGKRRNVAGAVAIAGRGKRKRKQKPLGCGLHLQGSDSNAIFALLLACISKPHSLSFKLINKCLLKIEPSLLSEASVRPILALLPTILTSRTSKIACRAADIIGAASLVSLEVNQEIASDSDTVRALILLLANPKRRISVPLSACNAVLDLSTTTFGQQQLLKFFALEKLMFVFLQIFKGLKSVSLSSEGNQSFYSLKIGIKKDELSVAFLSAIVVLINACEVEQLQNIPTSLCQPFMNLLKQIWVKVSDYVVTEGAIKLDEGSHLCKSNIGVCNLAESIFRLSMSASQLIVSLPFEVVQRGLFGASDTSFEDFISNYWEVSPFLLTKTSKDLNMYDMFSAFKQSLRWTDVPTLLSSILRGLVSCFPCAPDEQNIFHFLNEVKSRLGCPIIYHQDIRVVKTEKQSRKEMHYFQDFHAGDSNEAHYFTMNDVLKCVQAYKEGYTVALRGLEFRYQSIAAIADTLALMFGQPSVGANLYLTPPNSQGLARHFDDHCVFVCQILGSKQWTVFSQPSQLLPRLYDDDDLHDSDIDCTAGRREFFLREGDVLYIPRGFPHEAYTNCGVVDGSPAFSLHLTLSIEVEPPFEWEGVAHIALYCWSETWKRQCYDGLNSLSQKLDLVSVNMLHAAIGIISNFDPSFRKACLSAAVSLPPDIYNSLIQSQRNIFLYVIDKIRTESRFWEVLSSIEMAIQKNEDPFQQIQWLWLLQLEKGTTSGYNTNKAFMIGDLLSLCARHKDKLEAAFLNVKSRFCSEVVYDDVVASHRMLLQKYRKTRKQYINGMISLHDKF